MKKKIVGIFICMLLIVTMFSMLGTAEYEKYKVCNFTINEPYETKTVDCMGNGEILDQNQTKTYSVNIGICSFQWAAQGFKPTVMTLTRVDLYIYKYLTPPVDTIITVSIRDSLDGNDLTSIDFVTGEFSPNQQWVEFDFPDIQVVPEQIYYIVARGDYCDEDGGYMWTAGMYNPYDRGDAWWWDEYQGWEKIDYDELPECDMAFKTYGLNEAPDIPIIDGSADGKVGIEYDYNISTTDYEGYDIWYYIEWGDGSVEEWIGSYASGENVTVSHTWNIKKTYEVKVKAKDIHGAESDWGTLEIKMPFYYDEGCIIGTQITMASGSFTKSIEDIEVGEFILSYDPISQNTTTAEVIEVYEFAENPPLTFNGDLEVTPNHNLYINGYGWMEADDAQMGYYMLGNTPGLPETYPVIVFSKEPSAGPAGPIYNLVIQPLAGEACGYWADGILVGGYE